MSCEIYMTPREAAAYLKTSPSTLAKRRLFHDAPKFCRIGRAVRYKKTELDDFMLQTRVASTSDSATIRRQP